MRNRKRASACNRIHQIRRITMTPETHLPILYAKIPFDAEDKAKEIIMEHMEGYLQGCHAEYDNNKAMMEDMYHECAFILTNHMLEGKLTPLQTAAVRNALGSMIWVIFESYVNAEDDAKDEADR